MNIIVPHFTTPDGYSYLLAHHWKQGETFIVLEEDKHTSGRALSAIWDCPHPWCTYPIPMQHTTQPAPYPSLGCTKFSSSLMHSHPTLIYDATHLDLGLGEGEWSRLDLAISSLLSQHVDVHMHSAGYVEHRHLERADLQFLGTAGLDTPPNLRETHTLSG